MGNGLLICNVQKQATGDVMLNSSSCQVMKLRGVETYLFTLRFKAGNNSGQSLILRPTDFTAKIDGKQAAVTQMGVAGAMQTAIEPGKTADVRVTVQITKEQYQNCAKIPAELVLNWYGKKATITTSKVGIAGVGDSAPIVRISFS